MVGHVAAFNLTAPAAAAAPPPPPPPSSVLVDAAAAAAPFLWIDPVAAFGLTAPAAAAAAAPLSGPAAAAPPPLFGPAVGGVSPLPLPLLLTDGAPNQVTDAFENYPTFSLRTEYDLLPQCRFLNVDDLPDYVPDDKLSILVFDIKSCKNFSDVIFLTMFADLPLLSFKKLGLLKVLVDYF